MRVSICRIWINIAILFGIGLMVTGRADAQVAPGDATIDPVGQIGPAIVEQVKRATALVEMDDGTGSAFCIDSTGYFVTNAHVVEDVKAGDQLKIVLRPGQKDQLVVAASLVRIDAESDLAVLKVDVKEALPALTLDAELPLFETMPVAAFGYPFGTDLALHEGEYPSVTVSVGHITAVRKSEGETQQIQVDASLNPGNSGGPIVDLRGHVIGIVVAGIPGAAINFAIPVRRLRQLLQKPVIAFEPAPIPAAQTDRERDFNIGVSFLQSGNNEVVVTMTLKSGNRESPILVAAPAGHGTYLIRAVPIAKRADADMLIVNAHSEDGSVSARVRDQEFSIGASRLHLSQVQRIETAPASRAILINGDILTGAIKGLNDVDAKVGALPLKLDLGHFDQCEIRAGDPAPEHIDYRIRVESGGQVVGEKTGIIPITGDSASIKEPTQALPPPPGEAVAANLPSLVPPVLGPDMVSVKMPDLVEDSAVGGGGRYLILWLKRLHKIAIFDVSLARIVRYLSVEADDIAFTAGAHKLLVAINDQNILERWDIATGERELTLPIPDGMRYQSLAMGSATDGPALFAGEDLRVAFFDPATLRKMDIDVQEQPWVGGHAFKKVRVSASRDGSVFACWVPGSSIHGTYSIMLNGATARTNFHRQWTAHALPSPDGSFIYTDRGFLSHDLESIEPDRFNDMETMPCLDNSSYFLAFKREGDMMGNGSDGTPGLYSAIDKRLLVMLPAMPELARRKSPGWNANRPFFETTAKQMFFWANASLMITLPQTRDQLLLRHVDIMDAMDKAGIDYLFIDSTPPMSALKGALYSYQVHVRSKRGDVKYALDSGPPGMRLSSMGLLEWDVPSTDEAPTESVIVSIHDASGQELFHTFKITLTTK